MKLRSRAQKQSKKRRTFPLGKVREPRGRGGEKRKMSKFDMGKMVNDFFNTPETFGDKFRQVEEGREKKILKAKLSEDKRDELLAKYRETLKNSEYMAPIIVNYIETITEKIQDELGGEIYKAVAKYDIEVKPEELRKALEYDRNQYKIGYENGRAQGWTESLAVIRGEWVKLPTQRVECSLCKNEPLNLYRQYKLSRYCPYCGARMSNPEE